MAGDVPDPAPGGLARRGDEAAPIALYRRYRPATFAEVRGQEHVTEPLRQALRSGRVHHAYLFSGPRGCGKTSSARILARSLNCERGPTPDPCGVCASCVALAPAGPGSIDVIEIDAASHGGVDDARDLRERAFYAPVSGRFKIYIVDEAHMVTREGFNALLKLVEEPPPHLKFVFATTEPEKVIATIRSRTHHYPFRLMPPAVLRGLLEEILASEGVAYEPAVLPVVIRAGAGSARDALSVLDQLLAGADEAGLSYERAVALLGYTDDSLLDEVTAAFAAGDGAAVFHAVDRVVGGGHDPRRFAADLLDRFRDLIVLAAVPDAGQTGLLDVPADRLERMRQQAAGFGPAQLTSAAETISAGLVEMRGATSPRLLLELMCAQVLLPAPDAGQQALLARLERLERRIGTGDAEDAAPRMTSPTRPAAPEAPSARAGQAARRQEAGAGGPAAPAARPTSAESGNSSGTLTAAASAPAAESSPQAGSWPAAERSGPAAPPSRPASPAAARRGGGDSGSPDPGASGGAGPGAGDAGDAGSVTERWEAILEAVKSERKVSWILLSNASVDSLSDGVLTLSFIREGDAKGFTASGHDRVLSAVLERMLGISLKIRPVVGTANGAAAGGRPAAARTESGGGGRGDGGVQSGGGGRGDGGVQSGGGGRGDGGVQSGGGGRAERGPQQGAGSGPGTGGRYDADPGAGAGQFGSGSGTRRGTQSDAEAGPGRGGQHGSGSGTGRGAQGDAEPGAGRGGQFGSGRDDAAGRGGQHGSGSGTGRGAQGDEASGAGHGAQEDAASGAERSGQDGADAGVDRGGAGRAGRGGRSGRDSGSARGRGGQDSGSARGRGGQDSGSAPGRRSGADSKDQQNRKGRQAAAGAGSPLAGAQPGDDADADALTGADLIERELGGQVIEETGDA
jgi:DNA polymerase III subunit gamma/tau